MSEVGDPRLVFLGAEELIPKIDEYLPELWLGIDATTFPYLRMVKQIVETASDQAAYSDIVPDAKILDAATDAMFVQLKLHRSTTKIVNLGGRATRQPHFEELPVTGILSRKERLVLILGDAGSGKSTCLRRLAYLLAERGLESDKKGLVPVLLRANELVVEESRSATQCLIEATLRLTPDNRPAFSNDDLTDGNVVAIVDGLDEIGNDQSRAIVAKRLLEFHRQFPKCQVVAASRDYAFVRNLEELTRFEQFRLSPIDFRQAQQILTRFQKKKSLPVEKAKEILRRIQQVHGIDLNPLLVTVFAATADYSRKDVPANITELFKKYTEMMLGRWDATKGLGQQYHAPLKDFLLQRVAFEMHRQKATSVDAQEFRRVIETELKSRGHDADVDQIRDEILQRSGLLRSIQGRVEFRHHLLQEFFAGRGIPSEELVPELVTSEWWQRAVVFYFGEKPTAARGFELIVRAIEAKPAWERYVAAVGTGLALQACYLLHLDEKLKILPWIIRTLAATKEEVTKEQGDSEKYPLTRFVGYYLMARDSIACSALSDRLDEVVARLCQDSSTEPEQVMQMFWVIIGLIELGELERAQELIRRFVAHDARCYLAIQMSCVLVQHLRMSSKEDQRVAAGIATSLVPLVGKFREQLLGEFSSQLLEVRLGKIEAVEEEPVEESEGQVT